MAEAGNLISSARTINSSSSSITKMFKSAQPKSPSYMLCRVSKVSANSFKRNEFPLVSKNSTSHKAPRRLVKISTASDGRWGGNWSCDYVFSLKELQLDDLAEDGHGDSQVSINLCIHKHAGFGLSVDGRIITSFTRKCSNCSSPYCREIDTNFNVWVLPSSRNNSSTQLPEIGGDDPSVIYVKPGFEADLDSLIQETIRLTSSVKETCSDLCETSETRYQYIGEQKAASTDKRWSRLLELRNSYTS